MSMHALRRLAGCGLLLAVLLPSLTLAGSATPTEMGSGTAWLDFDSDGDLDLMYLTAFGDVLLFQYNAGEDKFIDVSESALPEITRGLDAAGMGVACGDFDNDGHVDIFLSMEGPNLLLMNNGDLTFRATTRASGISGEYLTASVGLIDYNNDGLLDMYLGNYAGGPNKLYRNDGVSNGVVRFTDVAPDLGMDYAAGDGSDWTLGIGVADYDNDGDSDLYVANDYNGPDGMGGLSPGNNILYRNEGDGTFTDVSVSSGAGEPGWAMGVAFGDYDGDGFLDIFLANFWEDALLRNQGDGTFENVTTDVGLITGAPGEWHYNGWGTSFIDFDNDGDLDIHVANGYIINDQDQVVNEPNQLWENKGKLGDHVQFEEIGAKSGVADRGDGRGAAYGDYNRDGLMDMMVINNGFLAGEGIIVSPQRMLYENLGNGTFHDRAFSKQLRSQMADAVPPNGYRDFTDNSWIKVRIEPPTNWTLINHSGVGARIEVTAGGVTQIRDVGAGSYCSSNSHFQHFGLGSAKMVDRIRVTWPNGSYSQRDNVPVDQMVDTLDMTVPVKLLAFDAVSEPAGARVSWSYVDDNDLAVFTLSRRLGDKVEVLAPALRTTDGQGSFLDTTAPADRSVEYVLDATLRNGTVERVGTLSYRHRPGAGMVAGQGYPNPFQSSARIPVMSSAGGAVSLDIFDATGRRVRSLRETIPAGESLLEWDGRADDGRTVAAGVYFYRLNGEGADHTRTLKLIRRP